jgi:hypothetical protein
MLFALLYERVDILFTYGTHFHDRTISLRVDIWAHKTSLTPPIFFCYLPREGNERLCICVLGVSILPLATIFLLDFGTFPAVWYFRTFPTVWYFRTFPTVWYFRTFPTVWYFRTFPTVWYFRTFPTVWYFITFPTVWYLFSSFYCKSV